MRDYLKSNSLKSIHFDTPYKYVPSNKKKLRLLVVSGYDELKNKTLICSFILIIDENFLKYLKY